MIDVDGNGTEANCVRTHRDGKSVVPVLTRTTRMRDTIREVEA